MSETIAIIVFLLFVIAIIVTYAVWRKITGTIFLIHLGIIILYNLVGWSYIFKYLDAGGASLGPGMLILATSGLHFFVSTICYFAYMSTRTLEYTQKEIVADDKRQL